MKKTASTDNGFLLAYFINLILNFEWAVISLILFGLTKWIDIPSFLWKITLGVWFVLPLVITFVMSVLISSSKTEVKPQPNVNPYSATNKTYPNLKEKTEDNDN